MLLYTSIGSPLYYSASSNSSREISSNFRQSAYQHLLAGQYHTGGHIGGYTGWPSTANFSQYSYNYIGGDMMLSRNHTEEMQLPQGYNNQSNSSNNSSDEEEATTLCVKNGDPKVDTEDQDISVTDDVMSTEDFICRWNDCDSCFDSADRLAQHVTSQHAAATGGGGGGQYRCCWQGCPRAQRGFNARYKMLVHIRTHTKEKPHKCSVCGKRFSRTENLKIHARSHSGERPYVCPVLGCNKAYSNSSDRFKHTRTHLTERPYACRVPGCQKRYTDPSSLRKHVKTFKHHQLQDLREKETNHINFDTKLYQKPHRDHFDIKMETHTLDKTELKSPTSQIHINLKTEEQPRTQPSPVVKTNNQKNITYKTEQIENAKSNKFIVNNLLSEQPVVINDNNHRINNHNQNNGYNNHEKSNNETNDIEMLNTNNQNSNLVNNHVESTHNQIKHQKEPTSHLVNNIINQENKLLNTLVTNNETADCKCSRHDCLEQFQKARDFLKIGAFLNNFAAAAAVAASCTAAAGCNNKKKSLLFNTESSCDVAKCWSKLWANQDLLITPEFLRNNYSQSSITENEAVMMDIDVPLDLTMHNK